MNRDGLSETMRRGRPIRPSGGCQRKARCRWLGILLLACGWTVRADALSGAAADDGMAVRRMLTEIGSHAGMAADSDTDSLRIRFDDRDVRPRRGAWGWTADDAGFGVLEFDDQTPRVVFRPLDGAYPDWPGMRMAWDYDALSAAGRQRVAAGALPLAAAGLLLLLTRRWT